MHSCTLVKWPICKISSCETKSETLSASLVFKSMEHVWNILQYFRNFMIGCFCHKHLELSWAMNLCGDRKQFLSATVDLTGTVTAWQDVTWKYLTVKEETRMLKCESSEKLERMKHKQIVKEDMKKKTSDMNNRPSPDEWRQNGSWFSQRALQHEQISIINCSLLAGTC